MNNCQTFLSALNNRSEEHTFPNFCAKVPVRSEWNIMMVSSRSHRKMR